MMFFGILFYLRHLVQDEEMEEDGEDMQQSTIDNYMGVSIKVYFCQLIVRQPTDMSSRCRSTQKLMKGCGYNSFQEDRNLWSLLLLVCHLLTCPETGC